MKKPYIGSVLFFKHLIIVAILLMITIPTVACFVLLSKQRALEEEITTLKAQLAAVTAGTQQDTEDTTFVPPPGEEV